MITIWIKVLAVIRENEFVQYPPSMKSGTNTRNLNKFFLFHRDHGYDAKNVTPWKWDRKIDCKSLPSTIHEKRDKVWARNKNNLHTWWATRDHIILRLFYIVYICFFEFLVVFLHIFMSPYFFLKQISMSLLSIHMCLQIFKITRDPSLGPRDHLFPDLHDRLSLSFCDRLYPSPHNVLSQSPYDHPKWLRIILHKHWQDLRFSIP